MTGQRFAGQTAVVTGATSGIGRAVALALAAEGASLHVAGRRREALDTVARAAGGTPLVRTHVVDLADEAALGAFCDELRRACDRVDVLVHSAGVYHQGPVETAPAAQFDEQYQVNVRAPYVLTQALLPALRRARGQVVFINSSVGLAARAQVSQYAATKHALRAVADALREEINPDGIRVLTVYAGRTATPLQEAVHQMEGKPYPADRLVQPADVARAVVDALRLERTAELFELRIRPLQRPTEEDQSV